MIRVGTMGWSYPFWVGSFYPKGLPPGGFLREYARHFTTVEVDSTFYRIPYDSVIRGWDEGTPDGFVFAAKFPRKISYDKRLQNVGGEAALFVERMEGLGKKLGPLLLQLPSDFGANEKAALEGFLDALPEGHRYVVEAKGKYPPAEILVPMLEGRKVGLAAVDSPQVPLVEALTSDFFYVRLEGDRFRVKGTTGRVEVDRESDLVRWSSMLREMDARAVDVYVYCGKRYSGHSAHDALRLKGLLSTA